MDTISKEKRIRNMSKIRSKDTAPEMKIRKLLYKKGFRYRLHYNIPGKPDIIFLSRKIAIFINGCFWHGHICKEAHIPKSNSVFWENKLLNNIKRDKVNQKLLRKLNWKVIVVWECEIEGNIDLVINRLLRILN
jgi:DNA mismatch endonuclease, patch repair protein